VRGSVFVLRKPALEDLQVRPAATSTPPTAFAKAPGEPSGVEATPSSRLTTIAALTQSGVGKA
jgi:hypothetical protein